MNLASNYFYKSHSKELSKYIKSNSEFINIVNHNSNIPEKLFNNVIKVSEGMAIKDILQNNSKNKRYDLIVLTDIFELSDDIYSSLKVIKKYLKNDGILILSSINPIWHFLITLFEKLGLKEKSRIKSYIKPNKIESILKATNFQRLKKYNRLYVPFKIFGLGPLLNFIINLLLPFLNLGIRNYLVYSNTSESKKSLSKSVLVPAKNEEGNLEELINRIPKFKSDYEIIIICGYSRDKTYEKSIDIKQQNQDIDITVLKQKSNGKANAIWEGLEYCNNDVIAVLDSDLSVDPEALTDFYEIIENGYADFVNGTRLIYQMEKGSMQRLNKFGNRVFQHLISKLISTEISDSLCGTKVFKKTNIEYIKKWQNIMYFKDPFCDFDLIFSTAYSGKKIVEFPVHYRTRKYGTTNISRFRDGWKLLFYFLNSYILFKTEFQSKRKFSNI